MIYNFVPHIQKVSNNANNIIKAFFVQKFFFRHPVVCLISFRSCKLFSDDEADLLLTANSAAPSTFCPMKAVS